MHPEYFIQPNAKKIAVTSWMTDDMAHRERAGERVIVYAVLLLLLLFFAFLS